MQIKTRRESAIIVEICCTEDEAEEISAALRPGNCTENQHIKALALAFVGQGRKNKGDDIENPESDFDGYDDPSVDIYSGAVHTGAMGRQPLPRYVVPAPALHLDIDARGPIPDGLWKGYPDPK